MKNTFKRYINLFPHLLSALCIILVTTSCTRNAKLHSEVKKLNNKCPIILADGMRIDSVSYHASSNDFCYYVTLFGINEESWMQDILEANLAGLDEAEVNALVSQTIQHNSNLDSLLIEANASISLCMQYSDGSLIKHFCLDTDLSNGSDKDSQNATLQLIRRDVENSNAVCPVAIADGITMQSVSISDDNKTIIYVYRIAGDDLTADKVDKNMLDALKTSLQSEMENSSSMQIYRNNGIAIRYSFENEKGEELYHLEFYENK